MNELLFREYLCVFAEFRLFSGTHLAGPEGKGFILNNLVLEVHALNDHTSYITILHQLLQNLHAHWCHENFKIHHYFSERWYLRELLPLYIEQGIIRSRVQISILFSLYNTTCVVITDFQGASLV